jgi:predicted dinucleotide-binding enzyme
VDVTVVGTGFIGGTLDRALAVSGHHVVFGSLHPESDDVAGDTTATVASVADAVAACDVLILALPSAAVADLARETGEKLGGCARSTSVPTRKRSSTGCSTCGLRSR